MERHNPFPEDEIYTSREIKNHLNCGSGVKTRGDFFKI
jgi:hypothetical protein